LKSKAKEIRFGNILFAVPVSVTPSTFDGLVFHMSAASDEQTPTKTPVLDPRTVTGFTPTKVNVEGYSF
jgi:hypothetical protein